VTSSPLDRLTGVARYLITGVSRGIGRAVAEQLIDAGHDVLGVAGVLVADLSRPDLIAASLGTTLAAWQFLDGVVHCAGTVRPGSLGAADLVADFTDQFAVNVTAVAELTRLLLPSLRAGRGTVVLVNSGSGLNARPPLSAYGASKFALRAYADALRLEEPLLRVSTVHPGRTATAMQRVVRDAEAGSYDETDYLRPATVAGVIISVLTLPGDGVITDVTVHPAS
jgi:NADP-dependent 3-hydroxy acid dehydrogenase YdfG